MVFINSTGNGSVYPWTYDSTTLDAYRRYAKAKVRLIPLLDRWSKRAAQEGTIGPVRPLVLDDPSPAARSIDDQWLLGKRILVAPVLEEGARSREVYLPVGDRWQRVTVGAEGRLVEQGKPETGGRTVTAPAPLEDIPIYVRAKAPKDEGEREQPDRGGGGGGRGEDERQEDRGGDGGGAVPATGGEATGDGGGLPFTGLPLAGLIAAAAALLLTGTILRGRVRSRGADDQR